MEHMELLLYSLLQKYVAVALVLAMYAVWLPVKAGGGDLWILHKAPGPI